MKCLALLVAMAFVQDSFAADQVVTSKNGNFRLTVPQTAKVKVEEDRVGIELVSKRGRQQFFAKQHDYEIYRDVKSNHRAVVEFWREAMPGEKHTLTAHHEDTFVTHVKSVHQLELFANRPTNIVMSARVVSVGNRHFVFNCGHSRVGADEHKVMWSLEYRDNGQWRSAYRQLERHPLLDETDDAVVRELVLRTVKEQFNYVPAGECVQMGIAFDIPVVDTRGRSPMLIFAVAKGLRLRTLEY